MEVGTEISQKIRSAIKAKLMEIGSYVDDELPDYIMVMVANKKTKQQMADDLSLFLATNTDVFTTWLHGLLVKLQTVSTDSSSSSSKSVKPKSTKDKKKDKKPKDGSGLESRKEKRKVSKTTADGGDASKAKSAKISSTENNEEPTAPENENSIRPNNLSKDGSGVGHEHQNINITDKTREDETKIGLDLDDVEDVRQLLVTETPADELAQELETTEAGIEKLASSASISKDTVSHISKGASVVIDRDMITSSREAQAEIAPMSRKRKCPSSVVATVRRNAERNEEDDRSTPVVASVVKVTSRKSSFPQSMQANSDAVSCAGERKSEDLVNACPPDGKVSFNIVKQVLSEVLIQWQDKEDDIRMFCKSIEKTLRKMTLGDLAVSKLKIQKILFDYEMSQHKSKTLTLRAQMGSQGSSPADVARRSNSRDTMACGSGSSSLLAASPLSVCHSWPSTSQDNGTSVKNNRPDVNQTNAKHLDASNSHTESVTIKSSLEESAPDRIIFGPKQSDTETARCAESRHLSDVKSSDGLVPLNRNERQSVSTAVSSTVIESSGLDSPSSSHPSNFVKWFSSSSNHKKLPALDSPQGSANSDLPTTILVSSLHQKKRRLDPDSPSVLRQSLSHDPLPSKNSQSQAQCSAEGTPDSSKQISPEQLKVLAKNLKITVVNKRALRPQGKSNSEDSSSEDSEDESDSGDEDTDEDIQETEEGNNINIDKVKSQQITDYQQEKTD